MRRTANVMLAGLLVAAALGAGVIARALPSSGAGAGTGAKEPYTSRWLCPVVPQVKGELTIANTGTKDAVLQGTMRWNKSGNHLIEPPATTRPPKTTKAPSTTKAPAQSDEPTTSTASPTTTTQPPPETTAPAPASEQEARPISIGLLKPGQVRQLPYESQVPSMLEVESVGAPVAVNGVGQPACAPGAATRWWVPVADVPDGEGDTRIVVANPGDDGATVQVTLHTTTTDFSPSGLESVFIPARTTRMLSVKQWLPSSAEQSVEVQARFGRIVVGALTTDSPRDKAPTIVPAQAGGRDSWLFAGGLAGEDGDTSLVLTNPGDTPLEVKVEVATTKKPVPLPNADDLEVAPGSMRSIAVVVDVDGPIGLRVRSRTGASFDAGLRVTTSGGATYVDAGGSGEDERWILPRSGQPPIAVANYSDQPLRYHIDDLAGRDTGQNGDLAPNQIVYILKLPPKLGGFVIRADQPGLVVRTANDLQAIPGDWVGGLSLRGQVRPGPAAG